MNPYFTEKQQLFIREWAEPPYKTQAQTARKIGVTVQTVTDWKHDIPEFWPACVEARHTRQEEQFAEERDKLAAKLPVIMREKVRLAQNANSEHVRHLELKDLADRILGTAPQRIEQTGKDGGPMKHEHALDMSGLTDEQLDTIIRRLGGGSESGEDETRCEGPLS